MRFSTVLCLLCLLGPPSWNFTARAGEIHDACALGNIDKVKAILDNRPELANSSDSYGRRPLHYAAQRGHKEIVSLLLDYKADVNVKATERSAAGIVNWTPLHLAAERGRVDVCGVLLDRGADIEAKDVWDRTPLFLAVLEDQMDVIELLVSRKADVNLRDKRGKTMLQRAIEQERKKIVDFLRANGAQE